MHDEHIAPGAFAGGGEAGRLLRGFDWSKTRLGPIRSWTKSLVAHAAMVLEMPSPALLIWGEDETQIYNDGYAVIMGPHRHPRYFGGSVAECWPDTYPVVHPWMRSVFEKGESVRVDRTHIAVTRHGFDEEAYFTFTFSPLRDDDGAIRGIFQPVVEVTQQVLGDRRAETLRALAPRLGTPDPVRDVMEALAQNGNDVPWALLYLWDERERRLALAGRTPNLAGSEPAFARVAARAHDVLDGGRATVVGTGALLDEIPAGPVPQQPAHTALLVPVTSASTRAVAVLGVSPRLHLDDADRGFLEQAAARAVDAIDASRLQVAADVERRKLRDLFMSAPAGICVQTGPEHVYELANPPYLQLVGRADVIGKTVREALPEVSKQGFPELLDQVLRTGTPFVGRETRVQLDRRGDGRLEDIFVDFVYQPRFTGDGAIDGILTFVFDVTEQVMARRELQAAQDRLNFALDAAGVGHWDLDLETKSATRSFSHDRIFGYAAPLPEWTVDMFMQHVHPDDRPRVAETFVRCEATGEDLDIECRIHRVDGSERWIAARGRRERSPEGLTPRMLGIVVDVTERKEAEVAREARVQELARTLRFSEMFVGVLGHDLRTPLAAIRTAADLVVSRSEGAERIAKPAVRIINSAERMGRMIEQVLDFTRARLGGGIPLQRSATNLSEVAGLVIDELDGARQGCAIRAEASGDVVGIWDRDRLAQLMSNLVGNAVAHGADGAVDVRLDGGRPDVVRLEVKNAGAIPPTLLPDLFEPFVSGSDGHQRSRGLGLGLFITKQIVLAHGGTIEVASSDAEGTRFVVELPRSPIAAHAPAPS